MNMDELRAKHAKLMADANAIVEEVGKAGRDMTAEERSKINGYMEQAKGIAETVDLVAKVSGERAKAAVIEKAETEARAAAERAAAHPVTQPQPDATLGMSPKEAKQYSFLRLIRSLSDPDVSHRGVEAAYELECSRAVEDKLGRPPKGIFVPADVLNTTEFTARPQQLRADVSTNLSKGTATAGGYLVATELQPQNFIEALRNKMVIYQAGARVLSGLVGNVDIPSQTAISTYYWVAENYNITGSALATGKLSLVPMTGGARMSFTRLLLKQSSIDMEMLIRDDLAKTCALGIQAAALNGTGTGEPYGLVSITGVSNVDMGSQGGYMTWAKTLEFETDVMAANADVSSMAWITNAYVRGKLKVTPKLDTLSVVPIYIWDDAGKIDGFPAYVTNSVKSDTTETTTSLSSCFFGCWDQMLIGLWGTGLDILVDPYAQGPAGNIAVYALQEIAIGCRHPLSFAYAKDIITS